MSETFDVLVMCGSLAFTFGGVLGYKLGFSRAETLQEEKRERPVSRAHVQRNRPQLGDDGEFDVVGRRPTKRPAPEPMPLPPVVKVTTYTPSAGSKAEHAFSIPIAVESDRPDVVAGLMNMGFTKKQANDAADACSLAERAGTMESWLRAAIAHATKKER